jgi:osmotically-inducible protein OsmY
MFPAAHPGFRHGAETGRVSGRRAAGSPLATILPVKKETVMVYGLVPEVSEALRDAVLDEIDKDPAVTGWEIGVAAEDGVVTLTGRVETLGMKVAAERAAKRVAGVRSVANDVHVRTVSERTDTDIAREALHRLRNNVSVPLGVQAVVTDGFITLDGTVHWMHQRIAAEAAVKHLAGVKGIANDITIIRP